MHQAIDNILRRLGKVLPGTDANTTREPLPRRWVDLIHHLNEQERMRAEVETTERQTRPAVRRLRRRAWRLRRSH